MFATFDFSNNMSVLEMDRLSTRVGTRQKINGLSFFQPSNENENERLGINKRSRNGCAECKRKKKRCDEIKPTCTRCSKAKIPCVWNRGFKWEKKLTSIPRTSLEISRTAVEVNNNPNIGITPKRKVNEIVEYNSERLTHDIDLEISFSDFENFDFGFENEGVNGPTVVSTLHKDGKNNNPKLIGKDGEGCKENSQGNVCHVLAPSPKNSSLLETLKTRVGGKGYNASFLELNFRNLLSSKLVDGLSDIEIVYLDYYKTCVSQTVSILPKESNFFLNLYLPLAENDKSILYALVGWAAVFLDKSKDQSSYRTYINKAIELSKEKLANKSLDDVNRLSLTSLYTILCAVLICAGDVKEWSKHFRTLHKILLQQSNGYLKSIKNGLGDYKESKWLVSNFLYHDVLSSSSHKNGTLFKMDEYSQILDLSFKSPADDFLPSEKMLLPHYTCGESNSHELIDNDPVCDPLQGCVRPLYVLIGEITNTFVELKNFNNRLLTSENVHDYLSHMKCRTDKYREIEEKYEKLENQIKNTKPHTHSLIHLKSDKDLELHLTLFETYRLCCLIHLKNLVKKLPPASPEIQALLLELLPCIEIVMGSNAQASLCFPLLIAGMSSIFESDRRLVEQKVRYMSETFPVKTFQRILVIIKESWRLNTHEDRSVYWFEISDKFGWDLSLA